MGLESAAKEIDFMSRASIVRGISSHLQCPGCNQLIQDPRMLACSHTYCRLCLDKAVKKTVPVGSQLASKPPNTAPSSASAAATTHKSSLEPFLLDQNLRRILGSSLNKELEASLSKIFDPDFLSISGLDVGPEAKSTNSKVPKKSKSVTKSKGSKSQGTTPASTSSNSVSGNSVSDDGAKKTSDLESKTESAELNLSKKQDMKAEVEVLLCPECGMHTEIPGGNVSLVPYNFFMQHIMDLMTYYSSAEPVPLVYCSMCRKDGVTELPAAVARCSTCASFLCKQCYELHSIDDFTKLHSTLSITERGDSSIFNCLTPDDTKLRNCKSHNWKPFLYYCITCSKGICEVCSKQEHQSHLFSKPEALRSDFVVYIRDLMSRTTQLRRRTENAVRTTQDLMSGIQLLAATQIEEVLRTQDVLSSALETRMSVLQEEVDKLSSKESPEKDTQQENT